MRSIFLAALLAPAALGGQRVAAGTPALWSSFGLCAHPTPMIIEVRADDQMIQRKTVRFCHSRDARTSNRPFATMMTFSLRGGRTFQDEYRTTRDETIVADVWQAGADTDAVVLGVSFSLKRQILLNTLHLLMPGKTRTDTLDRGLTVTSYPATVRSSRSQSHSRS